MHTEKYLLTPPSLEELAEKLSGPLASNFEYSSVSVVQCPDLRQAPFHLATEGISGNEKIADVGGQPNLFPHPQLQRVWSMADIARSMEMSQERGGLLGAGAGPFHKVGVNCELSPNLGWQGSLDEMDNQSCYARIGKQGQPQIEKSPSLDCALMINLYGSEGLPGSVLKIHVKKRIGHEKSFTECIRKSLFAAYGNSQIISLGGVFLIKSGRAYYHIMPDFPSENELPFQDFAQLNNWLTYHEFDGLMTCLSVLHSADPGKALGLRMEHTHGYSPSGQDAGGHYHYEIDNHDVEVEYEAYFNTAKAIYRVDKPAVTLQKDLHG
ncbi:hypothetical protein IWW34DRAFT_242755 [Fusarium oxysporum f. sp. albedinis]|nr:hypothetical protein IWW34DRAFT_242755 [Fusarium oxysporum f. sp. albedinis]KAJ0132217.1 hypothetical protein HZ326_24705 [Fusarium oxysporum f. sp. albedinis]KAK2469281.1 hypothetical protein H9L39_18998 [Fusarium oxysporum f. sp. albedinis]